MSTGSEERNDVIYKSVFDETFDIMPANTVHPLVQISTSIMMGMVFGLATEKGRVFEPRVIRHMMVFENLTMLKLFLTASATSMLVFSLLTMIPITRPRVVLAYCNFAGDLKNKSLLAPIIGSIITGCGMTLAGACPGMVLAQVGTFVPNAGYTLLGGFTGILLYSMALPMLPGSIILERKIEPKRLDETFHTPYFILALPVAACLGCVVFACEEYVPWNMQVYQVGSGLFGSLSWPPFVAGAVIGLLQVPAVTVLQDTIGSTRGMVCLTAQIQRFLPIKSDYLSQFSSGLGNWWQVFYLTGAIVGAHLSAKASNSLGTVSGVDPEIAFFGGILMLFGSRMAGGCTSGHGLSGMGFLGIHSLFAVPAMFGGAMALGFFMKYGLQVRDLPASVLPL